MTKHRIRRWLQFGILDLLILTTIVAVVAVLYRSPRTFHRPFVVIDLGNSGSMVDELLGNATQPTTKVLP